MLLSSLCASLASQQPERLIHGSLCYCIPGQVQVTTCVDLIGQRAITPNFFRTYKTLIFSCLDNNTLFVVFWYKSEQPTSISGKFTAAALETMVGRYRRGRSFGRARSVEGDDD